MGTILLYRIRFKKKKKEYILFKKKYKKFINIAVFNRVYNPVTHIDIFWQVIANKIMYNYSYLRF